MATGPAYFRTMQQFTATHPVELLEALMTHVGYATRTRARNALKRGEILVNGKVVSKGSEVIEPGTEVSILTKEELHQRYRSGGVSRNLTCCIAAFTLPGCHEDENVFVYENSGLGLCICQPKSENDVFCH